MLMFIVPRLVYISSNNMVSLLSTMVSICCFLNYCHSDLNKMKSQCTLIFLSLMGSNAKKFFHIIFLPPCVCGGHAMLYGLFTECFSSCFSKPMPYQCS